MVPAGDDGEERGWLVFVEEKERCGKGWEGVEMRLRDDDVVSAAATAATMGVDLAWGILKKKGTRGIPARLGRRNEWTDRWLP